MLLLPCCDACDETLEPTVSTGCRSLSVTIPPGNDRAWSRSCLFPILRSAAYGFLNPWDPRDSAPSNTPIVRMTPSRGKHAVRGRRIPLRLPDRPGRGIRTPTTVILAGENFVKRRSSLAGCSSMLCSQMNGESILMIMTRSMNAATQPHGSRGAGVAGMGCFLQRKPGQRGVPFTGSPLVRSWTPGTALHHRLQSDPRLLPLLPDDAVVDRVAHAAAGGDDVTAERPLLLRADP